MRRSKPKYSCKAERWLAQGGGGNECDIEDKKAMTVTWDGLVYFLGCYEQFLKEKRHDKKG